MDITAHKAENVSYHDPFIPTVKTNENREYKSVELTKEVLYDADAVVLTTNHSLFDVEFIQKYTKMVVDLLNMIKKAGDKVYKL